MRLAPADAPPAAGPASGPGLVRVAIGGVRLGGVEILGPLTFEIARGETLVLTGPSGIGKSTLLRCVAGLVPPVSGRVDAPSARAMVFQDPRLLPWRTALDNITIPTGVGAGPAREALAEVGLADRGGLYPGQLSLGQQRRLALARAFATQPDLLLLDEPFVSLDATLADEMMTLFQKLRRARSVATLLVTHSRLEARRLGDRVLRLAGSPAMLLA